ncbi:MAG TPA: tetratricopeptide repeat protein [Candidatus Acidoferrum sp.]|nr:tetratricopeptide repeat protein [Candidatus Acidoferrum sp.]
MTETTQSALPKRFGAFEFDSRARQLRKHGHTIRLHGQPLEILGLLLERPAEVVLREELRARLWPEDTFVDFEHSLNAAVNKLREALDDDANSPRFIETVPRRGYRFIAPVERALPASAPDSTNQDAPAANQQATDLRVEKPAAEVPAPAGTRTQWRTVWLAFIACAFLVALFIGLYGGGLRQRFLGRPDLGAIQSLAVLPLENLSRDPDQEYFADGMTEALTTELAQISALKVISNTSVVQYKGTKKSLPQIAQELGVDAVVEGAVQRSGDKVEITVQLIHAPTDRHLLAKSYERGLRDVLALQREVAHAIADEIKAKLTPQEKVRLASTRTINSEAYEDYLQGRFLLSTQRERDVRKGIAYFQQAIQKDQNYALAYAGLAESYISLGQPWVGGLSPKEALLPAKAAATKALEIDDSLGEAHLALARVIQLYDWDWPAVEKEYRRALELNPNDAMAHNWYGEYLQEMGRNEGSFVQMRLAILLDPLSSGSESQLGDIFYTARQYDQAIGAFQKALELEPDYTDAHVGLGWIYDEKKMYKEAIAELEKAVNLGNRHELIVASLGKVLGDSGRKQEARKLLEELEERSKHRYVSPCLIALVQVGLGEKDQAIASLEQGYTDRDQWILYLKVDPHMDDLRSDPRFQDLLRRVGFPQ